MGYIGTYYTCATTCLTAGIELISGVSGGPKWVQIWSKSGSRGLDPGSRGLGSGPGSGGPKIGPFLTPFWGVYWGTYLYMYQI